MTNDIGQTHVRMNWRKHQRHRRLRFVANNVRYCTLPGWNLPNFASRVLALNTRRLAADWQDRFDHPVILAETFVDPSRFNGTCYQAAGWETVGRTRGFVRHGRQWEEHKQPKTVWVRPLQRRLSTGWPRSSTRRFSRDEGPSWT